MNPASERTVLQATAWSASDDQPGGGTSSHPRHTHYFVINCYCGSVAAEYCGLELPVGDAGDYRAALMASSVPVRAGPGVT